ncbi:SAM-dependent methyltransferase [Shewanella sp. MBTL60-112-B2]|nr:SAM-dependent methyltransferase [Shewanella sp. MBTL60-112-B1]GIU27647.1 SAM-dependent methyltransferase [Shewanella sp. MBTL60-112-B2]
MIEPRYEHIWDCCCDHGLLGAALLARKAAHNIHFVDVVPSLMLEVQQKLQRFYPDAELEQQGASVDITVNTSQFSKCPLNDSQSYWQVHCLDVAQLALADKAQRQLIIIAGVGGELTIELVQQIIARHPQHSLEFILCPVHHIYKVRTAMAQLGLGLIDEHLMQENKRFYEILHLSSTSQVPLSAVGSNMWNLNRNLDKCYLQNTLKHYQRIAQGLAKAKLSAEQQAELEAEQTFINTVITDYQKLHASI